MISVSRRYSLPGNAMDKDSITSDASKKLLRALKKVHADKRQIFENGTKKYDKANKELSDAEQALEVENRSYERQIDDRKNRKIAIGNEIKHEREQQNSSNLTNTKAPITPPSPKTYVLTGGLGCWMGDWCVGG